jgi:hypothetical protein
VLDTMKTSTETRQFFSNKEFLSYSAFLRDRIFEEIKLETPSDPLPTIFSGLKSTYSVIPKIHKLTLN